LATNVADGWSISVQEDEARAEQLLLEALERDTNRSMAHATMGLLRRVENRWSEAKVELERAIVLDRNNTWAIRQLGKALVFMGQPEPAIPHLDKVLRLNPREASLAVTHAFFGWIHIFLDHMDEAMDFFRKARAENPRLWYTHLWFAGAMGLRGDMDE